MNQSDRIVTALAEALLAQQIGPPESARERRRRHLNAKPKGELADMLLRGVRTPTGYRANCGPKRELMKWRKDEIVGDILDAEFGS